MKFEVTPDKLRKHILKICATLDFQALAKDVQPFLFNPNEVRRVLQFSEYMKAADL